jgi:hypothetical protein
LTLTIAAGAVAGTYPLTVVASGTGVSNSTQPLSVTVTAVASLGYTLSLSPNALSLAQGANGQTSISIARTGGFAGSVALTVENAPAGLTASLNPASTTGNGATLSLVVSASLAPGTYTLTLRGVATGLSDRTNALQVTITAAGGSGNVTLDLTACNDPVLWVASQDGTGAWTQRAGANNVYQFTNASAVGGFAWVTQPFGGSTTKVTVHFMTRAELSAGTLRPCATNTGLKLINGSVAGMTSSQLAYISLGNAFNLATAAAPNFGLPGVLDNAHDLVAYLSNGVPSTADRWIIHRDLNIATNGSVGTLNFSTEGLAAVGASVTVTGMVAGEGLSSSMTYLTGATCDVAPTNDQYPGASTFNFYGVPAALQRATDFHMLSVTSTNTTGDRTVAGSFHLVANRAMTLPGFLTNPTSSVLNGSYKRLQLVFGFPADYNRSAMLYYVPTTGVPHAITVLATAGYIGSSTATLALPNFTGVAGWQDSWAVATGVVVNWTVTALGGDLSSCAEGARMVRSIISGSN